MSRSEEILRQSPARMATSLFAAQSAAAIIIFPISLLIARALGPTGYGEYQLQLRIALITVTVVNLGLPNALTWATAHASEPRSRARVYELAVVSAIGLGTLPVLVAIILASSGHHPGSFTTWLIFGFYPLVYMLVSHIQSSLRGALLVSAMAQIRIINAVLWLIAVVVLSLVERLDAVSGALALVCCTLIAGIFGVTILERRGAWRGSDKSSTSFPFLLRFGARSAPGLALRDWNVYADQIVVGLFLSTTELGFYALAASFTLALAQLTTPIAATAQPLVQRAQSSGDRLRMVTGLLGVTIPAITLVCLVVAVFAGWLIPTLFGTAFAPAVPPGTVTVLRCDTRCDKLLPIRYLDRPRIAGSGQSNNSVWIRCHHNWMDGDSANARGYRRGADKHCRLRHRHFADDASGSAHTIGFQT